MPLLKQGEYDTWRLRIESYIQLQDYSLWEIIEEGNSFKPVAQTTREADGEIITPKELNLKFLRSLPTKWGMHVVVWRNKSDLGSISFDDLYNNFKIVEPEVKRSVNLSSTQALRICSLLVIAVQMMVNTANVHVSTVCSPVSMPALIIALLCLSDATIYAYLATHTQGSQECRNPKSQENRSRSQDSSRRTVNVEEGSFLPMLCAHIDGTDLIGVTCKEGFYKLLTLMALSDSERLASVEGMTGFYKED
ncbi:hypothetical protein Tco_1302689 [Tanacetum coccineum]